MSDQLVEGTRLVLGILLLAYAGMSDIRTRRVTDMVWLVMGTAGFVLMLWDLLLPNFSWPLLLGIAGAYLAMLDMMVPRPEIFDNGSFNVKGAVLPVAAWGMLLAAAVWDIRAAVIPVIAGGVILLVYLMYRFNLITGGADAKALMAISMLVPTVPSIEGVTLFAPDVLALELFPFAILAFIMSGVMYLLSFLYLFVRNIRDGSLRFPQMFIGYRMPVESVPGAFVWSLEVPEDTKVRLKPTMDEESFDPKMFKSQGRDMVWVTPQHPGVAYLVVGFMLAFYLGNPFMVLGLGG